MEKEPESLDAYLWPELENEGVDAPKVLAGCQIDAKNQQES